MRMFTWIKVWKRPSTTRSAGPRVITIFSSKNLFWLLLSDWAIATI